MAFPFMTGFYSKDLIQELALAPRSGTNTIAYLLTLIAALQTATYSARLMIMTFLSKPHYPRTLLRVIHDPSIILYLPLFLQGQGAAYIGYLTNYIFLAHASTFYLQSIFIHPKNLALQDVSLASTTSLKYLPILTLLLLLTLLPTKFIYSNLNNRNIQSTSTTYSPSFLTSNYFNHNLSSSLDIYFELYTSILNHFDIIQNKIINNGLNISIWVHRYLDRGLIEIFGPYGLLKLFHYLAFKQELLATAFIPNYGLIILIFIIFILANLFTFLPFIFILILLYIYVVS